MAVNPHKSDNQKSGHVIDIMNMPLFGYENFFFHKQKLTFTRYDTLDVKFSKVQNSRHSP